MKRLNREYHSEINKNLKMRVLIPGNCTSGISINPGKKNKSLSSLCSRINTSATDCCPLPGTIALVRHLFTLEKTKYKCLLVNWCADK